MPGESMQPSHFKNLEFEESGTAGFRLCPEVFGEIKVSDPTTVFFVGEKKVVTSSVL